ncbi:DUF655 domain-containing protein [Candidatus Woesearchaeota archaeon]|nr:MAG: DUF655 domain-containing protein [Candidatus Woesearchaeota archaeon]
MPEKKREEVAVILDFLPNGYPFDKRPLHLKNPIAQAIGKERFTLLELVAKKGVFLQPYEEVYIGAEKRDKIRHVNGRLPFGKLTETAKSELPHVVAQIVSEKEQEFVHFLNTAQPLNTRMHIIELLPGIGKKHMWEILEAREEGPFKSFEDIRRRVKLMPDPKVMFSRRITDEIMGKEKRYLFTEP